MNPILFSIMCYTGEGNTRSPLPDLFTLSSMCKETRSIFTSRALWREKFSLLGIEHEEPSLQVYLSYLRIEKRLLTDWPVSLPYDELDLDGLLGLDETGVLEYKETSLEKDALDEKANKEREQVSLVAYYHTVLDLRLLPHHSLVIEKKKDKYTLFKQREKYNYVGHELVKTPLLSDLSKVELLNILLVLFRT